MPSDEDRIRAGFGIWIRERMATYGYSERRLGAILGMPSDWLDRFERAQPRGDQLTWTQAWRLIQLLGGDPETVISTFLEALEDADRAV
jgi:hypothetical protein